MLNETVADIVSAPSGIEPQLTSDRTVAKEGKVAKADAGGNVA
jgi:hypothetical protein